MSPGGGGSGQGVGLVGLASQAANGYVPRRNNFERNTMNTFFLKSHEIGDLSEIEIGHDGAGAFSDWHLEQVVITDSAKQKRFSFIANQWLDKVWPSGSEQLAGRGGRHGTPFAPWARQGASSGLPRRSSRGSD